MTPRRAAERRGLSAEDRGRDRGRNVAIGDSATRSNTNPVVRTRSQPVRTIDFTAENAEIAEIVIGFSPFASLRPQRSPR